MAETKSKKENVTCPHCGKEHCDLTQWVLGELYYCVECRGKFVITGIKTIEFYTTKTQKDFEEGGWNE